MEQEIQNNPETTSPNTPAPANNAGQIAGAIIVAGLMIAGAILLRGNTASDFTLGLSVAPVTVVVYADFQCPFCDRFFKDSEKNIRDTYVKDNTVQLVYRDFAFLGPESSKASEAARCAGEQGQFWEYHDYLYNHQNGENRGAFANANLKSFAKELKLK